jgi:ABC transport system ATP-binding/permease protein
MSEELLKAIVQLFAIVAKERITEDERANIKEFLSLHLNQESTRYYLSLFDDFCKQNKRYTESTLNVDEATLEFVDDWSQIIQIAKKVNQALTMQQKAVLTIKIIELCYADGELSERQSNLIYYIAEALKIPQKDIKSMRTFVTGQDIEELASKNILIIDEGSDNFDYPGPRIVAKDLTGLIAILRLNDIETYFIKYLGITPLYLNTVLLKSRKIDVFPTGSAIRGSKIDTIYYSDVVSKFLMEEVEADISFVAEHVFYHFKSGKAGLQNINIAESGGKLIGLMGASGSGKSTLLSVLNGSEKPSSGRVIINGIDIHKEPEKIQGAIGFIPQDDLLIEDLTVFENLYYAARLCFGHYSKEKITEIVERVLLSLGLLETRNLKVGSPLQKTISGGQRKRLNIGLELLREPTILFVDEPTSGLSSRDSENIMDLLKELSLRGKMIFVVIHQPSSDIFKMFDTLIILDVGGFQIYYGNPVESVNYFQDIVNAANKTPGACPECGNINPEQVFNIIETRVVNEFGRFTHARKVSPGQWYQYFKQKQRVPKVEEVHDALPVIQKIPNWFKQLQIFITRDVLSKVANKQYVMITVLLAPVLGLFISYFVKYYEESGKEQSVYTFFNNANIPVYFFMSVVVALFIGLIISAEEIFRDRKILKRERFLHLSSSSYLVSKVIILFAISAFQTFTFIIIGNSILEIPLTEMRYWWILFSTACFANVLGLNISSAFDSAVTIYIIIPILIIPQLLLSGVVVPFDKFNPKVGKPDGIPVMGELMVSRWAYEAYMVTQYKDNPVEKQFYALDQKSHNAKYKLNFYLEELKTKLSNIYNNSNRWNDQSENNPIRPDMALLKSELTHEMEVIPLRKDQFPEVDFLQIGKFNMGVYDSTNKFLEALRKYYQFRDSQARLKRDSIEEALTDTEEKGKAFFIARMKYLNSEVANMVEGRLSTSKIVEYNGRLIQKADPVFFDEHRPKHLFDFSAIFYSPTKHFIGEKFDTFYFNIAMIWVFVIVFYATLYFQVFKRMVDSFTLYRKYYRKMRE